jgi:hypothetical protein
VDSVILFGTIRCMPPRAAPGESVDGTAPGVLKLPDGESSINSTFGSAHLLAYFEPGNGCASDCNNAILAAAFLFTPFLAIALVWHGRLGKGFLKATLVSITK